MENLNKQQDKAKEAISYRLRVLQWILVAIMILFLFKACSIINNDRYKDGFAQLSKDFIFKTNKVSAQRGNIYSRNGDVLATSITRTTVYIDFGCERFQHIGFEKYKEQSKILAQTLADCIGDKRSNEYYNILIKNNRRFINYGTKTQKKTRKKWMIFKEEYLDTVPDVTVNPGAHNIRIFRDLDANEWEVIKNSPLLKRGVTYSTEKHDHRIYPLGDRAARTIGRLEHHRCYGIESAYRDTLAGHDGRQRTQRITNRYRVRIKDKDNVEVQNGCDVVTTLDVDIQDMVHSALSDQIIKENAFWGTTIVMECATGDILAMANLKRDETTNTCHEGVNYAIGVPVNPGSTFKLITAMALLENGVPTTKTYDAGLGRRVKLDSRTGASAKDSHAIGTESGGIIDMRTAFAESSNVYFTKAAFDCFSSDPKKFSDFCRKLRIDSKVGLEELGARSKYFAHLDHKHQSRYNALVNIAYGYGVEVTPLHTIAIYNAVANNGRMVAPRLVLRTERDGEVVNEAPVRVLDEQICSKRTLDTLRSFMEAVSQNGTAKHYFNKSVCPFSSGSKTGTAQVESVIDGKKYKKSDGYYYGSMVTYFPAESPRYIIMTAIFTKEQKGKQSSGAGLAGPVQKQVATFLYNRNRNYAQTVSVTKHHATNIKGGNTTKMQTISDEYGVNTSINGDYEWGRSDSKEGDKSATIEGISTIDGVVPNVVGMGVDDALFLLEKCGLKVTIVGCGAVKSQSLAPNTKITNNNRQITITLK